MKTVAELVREHPFFDGMAPADVEFIGLCGQNQVFRDGDYVARENEPADYFYLVRRGQLTIETFLPNKGSLCLKTLRDGDIFGWSWLFPPYCWTFDVRARGAAHLIKLDGKCLRTKCAEEPRLGYQLMQRFSRIMTDRLRETRLQLLDMYGKPGQGLEQTQ